MAGHFLKKGVDDAAITGVGVGVVLNGGSGAVEADPDVDRAIAASNHVPHWP